MLMQTLLTAAFSALALGVALAAEPASLSGDELRKAVSGKTVYLRISGFELPIHYSPGGSMAGGMGGVAATVAREESACPRQMVGLGQSALPAMVELDGGEDLLIQAHPPGQ
jgi:hypothetical protein